MAIQPSFFPIIMAVLLDLSGDLFRTEDLVVHFGKIVLGMMNGFKGLLWGRRNTVYAVG